MPSRKRLFLVLIGLPFALAWMLLAARYATYGLPSTDIELRYWEDALALSACAWTVQLPGVVAWMVLIHRMWSALPPAVARTTPGMAVGLCFVPLFNLYWVFVALLGWAQDANTVTQPALRIRTGWFAALPAVIVASGLAMVIAPDAGLLVSLVRLVVTLAVVNEACNAIDVLGGHRPQPPPRPKAEAVPASDRLRSLLAGGINGPSPAAALVPLAFLGGVVASQLPRFSWFEDVGLAWQHTVGVDDYIIPAFDGWWLTATLVLIPWLIAMGTGAAVAGGEPWGVGCRLPAGPPPPGWQAVLSSWWSTW